MSIQALTWAFSQQIRPATRKLVLICLADCANHEHMAWPCLETLADKTSLDRKTIIDALDDLEQFGYLIDTGKKCGRTNQVKVYILNGLPSSKFHYVYRMESETGEFYIGVRSSAFEPLIDSYSGSGLWPTEMMRKKIPLKKIILATFENRYDAETFEVKAVSESLSNELCRNKTVPKPASLPKSPVSPNKQFRFSQETVPLFPPKGSENGTRTLKGTPIEPGMGKPPRELAQEIMNIKDVLASNRERVEKLKKSHYHIDTRTWNNEDARMEVASRRKNITKLEKQMADLQV